MVILKKKYVLLFIAVFIFIISSIGARMYYLNTRSYEQVLLDDSPIDALIRLQKDINSNSEIARNCHPIAHKLGQLAFDKYQSFYEAARYQHSVCNSGYIHGVIESELSGSKDIASDIKSLCQQNFPNYFTEWQCFHGIGHGIMYFTNNNLPLSLQYCMMLSTNQRQGNCANGVYMENFTSDAGLHPTQYTKNDDLTYPCSNSDFLFQNVCYYNLPIKLLTSFQNDYMKVYELCLGVEEQYIRTCITGIAGELVKRNYDDVMKVEYVCQSFDQKYRSSCIHAMIGMYINMKGEIGDTEEICKKFSTQEHQKYCLEEIIQKSRQFSG